MDMNYLPFVFPGLQNIGCAFGLRGKDSGPFGSNNISLDVGDDKASVRANRKHLQDALGFEYWQEVRQVHGQQIIFDPEPGSIEEPGTLEADGLATTRPGLALVIKTADCQPILLAHKSGKHIAALHAGWRGNVLKFPATGVRDFCEEYDISASDVMAVRGPSLGPGKSEFTNFGQEFGSSFEDWYDRQTQCANLWRMTRDQLVSAGIPPANVYALDLCTMSLPELFFSYRREQVCGRQASIIWIRS
ncbi:polyphenol oxidase family protein [Desulfovibrio ferrophilus]|uniref:Multi-copper polyphenol oxidoreductase, laccase n=1 Tax=Desulfovibrio ferrophilus TaxID=241368 RepID=A0A2Z6AVS0_9BACT|nr:polyphenol oxidase family protein [Desulfovibrio ferrophilus]BBD07310.1 multi-copper polyphenol oxidoreductase, laccase [Desulfovibrio ferrophilus]